MSPKSRREEVPGTADHLASTALGESAYLTKYQEDLDLLKLNQRLEAGDITRADFDLQKQNILQTQSALKQTGAATTPPVPVPQAAPGPGPAAALGKTAYLTKYQEDLDLLKLDQLLESGAITQADYDVQKQKVLNALPDEPEADTHTTTTAGC